MRAVVLSAVPRSHPPRWSSALASELGRAGYGEVTTFDLAATKLAYCQGEFDCWVRTPGQCRVIDEEVAIVQAIHDADALVLLGPLTFGGHGFVMKRALDRMICLLEPFFSERASLTHHEVRYTQPAKFFAIGYADGPPAVEVQTFAQLAEANALNFLAPAWGSVVLDTAGPEAPDQSLAEVLASTRSPGETIRDRAALRAELLAASTPTPGLGPTPVQSAAILIGSPKVKGSSASEQMARALSKKLEAAGVQTELHFATEFVHNNELTLARARAMAARQLLILATPLYIDSFPSLTIHALEQLHRARQQDHPPAHFALIINCGFPEPEHNRTAIRQAQHFSTQSGYAFGGALPLGGGGVLTPDQDLEQARGPILHIAQALSLAAATLPHSGAVSPEAIEKMMTSPIPDLLYRLLGDLGWRWQAHQSGLSQRALWARPLDRPPSAS